MRAASAAVAAVAAFLIASLLGIYYYTEYLWFESLGYAGVFVKVIEYSVSFTLLVFGVFLAVLVANNAAIRKVTEDFLGEPFRLPFLLDVAIAFFVAVSASPLWHMMLFYFNAAEFGIADPVFGFDASFYVFRLPFLKFVLLVFLGAAIVALMISIIAYAYVFSWVHSFEEFREIFPHSGFLHLAALLSSIIALAAAVVFLSRYELVHSQHGLISGASYVDVHVRIPAYTISAAMLAVLAVVVAYLVASRKVEAAAIAAIAVFGLVLLAAVMVPLFIQKFVVEPNEIAYEEPYIAHSINYTLYAYGLANVELRKFNYSPELSYDDVLTHRATVDNIRIWDHRPLRDVFRQLQQIRPYYVIYDVDVDRYYVNGSYVQLMLAARELSTENLPARAKTWVNEHLIYTHGYGVVASPVNAVSEEGLPAFYLYDIPPKGVLRIDVPQIYYGELTDDYVVVKTLQPEFDYPLGEKNVFTHYNGSGGVELSGARRLLFAMRFGDVNLLLSEYITDESRIMLHRSIKERVRTLMPFFGYDADPYVAIINGRIYWIIDAYSKLDNFPYSMSLGSFNYMRNPVKVFIDAYNGSVEFYVVDDDALVKTLENAFPGVFKKSMPKEFRKHIRYPRDYFEVQAEIYATYHMRDVVAFYNREDVWDIAREKFAGSTIDVEPYYVTLSLDEKPEFVLILPMTPKNRDNLVAWMAARCDERYGELIIYEFPKGALIYGPMQVEARIDQDPELSKLFTLWGQMGSEVIRGNLLVVPIENSLLYVEPIYLQAESAKIPELRGVVIAHEERLAMGSDLYSAIEMVFKGKVEKEEKLTAEDILQKVREYYDKMIDALKNGRWEEFGEYLEKIGEILKKSPTQSALRR